MTALVLLPPADVAAELVQLSGDLAHVLPSQLVLGAGGVPHLTLVQCDAPASTVDRIAERLTASWGPDDFVTAAGLALVPGGGETWLEVPVLRSSRLSALHDASVKAVLSAGHAVVSGAGDSYRPHVTVGYVEGTAGALPSVPEALVRGRTNGWTLRAAELGPHFSVPAGDAR